MDLPATINIFLLHLHLESWAAASDVEAFFGPSNDPTWKPSSAVETAAKRPSKGPSCIKLSKVEKGSLSHWTAGIQKTSNTTQGINGIGESYPIKVGACHMQTKQLNTPNTPKHHPKPVVFCDCFCIFPIPSPKHIFPSSKDLQVTLQCH